MKTRLDYNDRYAIASAIQFIVIVANNYRSLLATKAIPYIDKLRLLRYWVVREVHSDIHQRIVARVGFMPARLVCASLEPYHGLVHFPDRQVCERPTASANILILAGYGTYLVKQSARIVAIADASIAIGDVEQRNDRSVFTEKLFGQL